MFAVLRSTTILQLPQPCSAISYIRPNTYCKKGIYELQLFSLVLRLKKHCVLGLERYQCRYLKKIPWFPCFTN